MSRLSSAIHSEKAYTLRQLLGTDADVLLAAVNEAVMVSVTDAHGKIIYVNDMFVQVSKYSKDELIGKKHNSLKSGEHDEAFYKTMWQTILNGKTWRGEIKDKAKDGTVYWVDTTIVPVLDYRGAPKRFVSVRFVISDRKSQEEKTQRQNAAMMNVLEDLRAEKDHYREQVLETQKFALAVENSGEHIVITDPQGIVLYANGAAERTTGYSQKEILGTKAGVLWGRQMPPEFYQQLWEAIAVKKQIFQGEITNMRKGGIPYIAAATIAPVLDKEGNVRFFIGTERDVTKEREVDKAKTEFVSLASHQLRTPLSSINWYSEMLMNGDGGKLTAKQKSYLKEVYMANDRMIRLINSLLNVSRIELDTFGLDVERINLKACAEQVLKEINTIVELRKQKLEVEFEPGLPTIVFDKQYLEMIYQNLLSNASKYSPEKSRINLRVQAVKKGQQVGKKELPAKGILIFVEDNGYGIPKTQQAKIFTKMFRADNARMMDTDGTGLGLYIIKSIVEYCHGRVWFESRENQGTKFYVFLPLKTAGKISTKKIE